MEKDALKIDQIFNLLNVNDPKEVQDKWLHRLQPKQQVWSIEGKSFFYKANSVKFSFSNLTPSKLSFFTIGRLNN